MKLGILTFNNSINFGSILQCYSLSKILACSDYNVKVINYYPDSYAIQYKLFERDESGSFDIMNIIKRLPIAPFYVFQKLGFKLFSRKYFSLTTAFSSSDSYDTIFNRYDAVVCGGDQIWNVRAKDCDDIYFLPFNVPLKIAYSISVNTTDFKEDRCNDFLKNCISSFDYLSIREKSGAEKVSRFINNKKDVRVTLDPTLLLDIKDFDIISTEPLKDNPYIALYSVQYNPSVINIAKAISNSLNLPILTVMGGKYTIPYIIYFKNGIKVSLFHNAPGDFISLIKNASYVITNSFHGTAFSIIYEKPFIAVNTINDKSELKNDERIISLLDTFGLDYRYVSENDEYLPLINQQIPYDEITDFRHHLASYSIDWLINALSNK